ncbi:alkaline phosphatase [Arcticibacterium luteifluviistationis]|uniref:Alkaline phosphatase n=1 Tax=Arcticibacterium luteifluviistationis TaxID=1784714 RepID=A0A2Z4GDK5_9BACT|nr:alkaline phosphatase [Arcticibacterium luteifluviistationis]AWV99197.1 alkaline phosphatase [Arcticibacterium luteifluviistationis]
MNKLLVFLFLITGLSYGQNFQVHSHNDYAQDVPFWKAFSAGCASIESDLILQNGKLMVAHNVPDIKAVNTFENLYLKPLQVIMNSEQYEAFDLQILIDFKTAAEPTLKVLMAQLEKYPELINGKNAAKKVSFVISGKRPEAEQYENYPSYINFDHQTVDTWPTNMDKVALVSLPFYKYTPWNGKGRLTSGDEAKLKTVIDQIHAKGKKVRFWATPDSKTAWYTLSKLGIDFINTDEPFACNAYLATLSERLVPRVEKDEATFKMPAAKFQQAAVILMVGDGTGLAQISAGILSQKTPLNLARIKSIGLIKTEAADDFTTDSAAGGTALATGKKTNNRYIGLDAEGKELLTIFDAAEAANYSTGIVTTDGIAGATPSAFYAHAADRDSSKKIGDYLLKSQMDIFIAGGGKAFKNTKWENRKIVSSISEIGTTSDAKVGFFAADGGLPYITEGRGNYLPKATMEALNFLEKKNKPFTLLIENGHIDGSGHANKAKALAAEVRDFDKAIGLVMQYVDSHPETLLIITADHETGGVTLPHGTKDEMEVQFHSDDHTGILVPLFAYGKGAEKLQGIYDNTEVYQRMVEFINAHK